MAKKDDDKFAPGIFPGLADLPGKITEQVPEYDSKAANQAFTAPARAVANFFGPGVEGIKSGLNTVAGGVSSAAGAVNRGVIQPTAKGMAMDFPTSARPTAAPQSPDLAAQVDQGRRDVAIMRGQVDKTLATSPSQAREELGMSQAVFPGGAPTGQRAPLPPGYGTKFSTVRPDGRPDWEATDPTLMTMQMSRTPQERANLAPTLDAKLSALFPGMSKGSRGSLSNRLYGLVTPGMPQQAGGPGFEAVASAAAEKPTFKTLSAGQTLYQIGQDGKASPVVTAPGETGAQAAAKGKETQQAMDMFKTVRKDYAKSWDKITEDVVDPVERTKALRQLNSQYFQSMGIPPELAEIPVSFKPYLEDNMQKHGVTSVSRDQVKALHQQHQALVKRRNAMLKEYWGGKLQFGKSDDTETKD
jgi:hypothetical protein